MNLYALDKGANKFVPVTASQLANGGEYIAVTPTIVAGANKTYFDLFNAEAGYAATVRKITPVVIGSVAVTGALSVDLYARRTTDVGTGGAAMTFAKSDSAAPNVPAGITARSEPTGGATLSDVLGVYGAMPEEASTSGAYFAALVNLLSSPLVLRTGEGLAVAQGAIASVGNFVLVVAFSVEKVS